MSERQLLVVRHPGKTTAHHIERITELRGCEPNIINTQPELQRTIDDLSRFLDAYEGGTEVVVIGGDGVLLAAVNALRRVQHKQPLLVALPAGTENDGPFAINGSNSVDYAEVSGGCEHEQCWHQRLYYPLDVYLDGAREPLVTMVNHMQGMGAHGAEVLTSPLARTAFGLIGRSTVAKALLATAGYFMDYGGIRLPRHEIQFDDEPPQTGQEGYTNLDMFNGRTAGAWRVAEGRHTSPDTFDVLYAAVHDPVRAAQLGRQLVDGTAPLRPTKQVSVTFETPSVYVQSDGEKLPAVSKVRVVKGSPIMTLTPSGVRNQKAQSRAMMTR